MTAPEWHSLGVSPQELRCDVTLSNGQCFGWRKHPLRDEWTGVIAHHVVALQQTADDTLFAVHHPPDCSPARISLLLRDYFFLDRVSISALYRDWSADRRFSLVSPAFTGLRLIRQEPVECLFSFICSSANNIPRITSMLHTLRSRYGQHLCTLKTETDECVDYHAFPSLERLALIPPLELRGHSFGYRADYIVNAAVMLQEKGGADWMTAWRSADVSTEDVAAALQELPGVGPKVAACVALFSLDRLDMIPVDTHVFQIALRDYVKELPAAVRSSKSVSRRVHDAIAAFFQAKFGAYAGWAHSVLFTAELPAFRHRLGLHKKGATARRSAVTVTVTAESQRSPAAAAAIADSSVSSAISAVTVEMTLSVSRKKATGRKGQRSRTVDDETAAVVDSAPTAAALSAAPARKARKRGSALMSVVQGTPTIWQRSEAEETAAVVAPTARRRRGGT